MSVTDFLYYSNFFDFSNRILIFGDYDVGVKRTTEHSTERMMVMTILQVRHKKIKQEKTFKQDLPATRSLNNENLSLIRRLKAQRS